ncbi:MAG: hypothetical protein RIR86_1084, partial [Acidobacteriota bacterium]
MERLKMEKSRQDSPTRSPGRAVKWRRWLVVLLLGLFGLSGLDTISEAWVSEATAPVRFNRDIRPI